MTPLLHTTRVKTERMLLCPSSLQHTFTIQEVCFSMFPVVMFALAVMTLEIDQTFILCHAYSAEETNIYLNEKVIQDLGSQVQNKYQTHPRAVSPVRVLVFTCSLSMMFL